MSVKEQQMWKYRANLIETMELSSSQMDLLIKLLKNETELTLINK